MKATGLRTDVYRPGQDLVQFVVDAFSVAPPARVPREGDIICITSKIVSLAEGRLEKRSDWESNSRTKKDLIHREADVYLADGPFGVSLTIKHGIMIPSAGIDESNSETGDFILYPVDPWASAKALWSGLRKHWGLQDLGVLITDSHTQPLRRGVIGVALSYWGFHGVKDLVGAEDIFGRELKFTKVHVADALAAASVLLMGEANERTPLVLIEDAHVAFSTTIDPREGVIPPEDDLYLSLYERSLKLV
jgi:dihydrofolate synthase / folylpolyglutamate synthase